MRTENDMVTAFRQIRVEYAYNPDVMTEDTPVVAQLKRIIEELPQVDRTIILLYIDCQSYRKLGKMMGLSHMTVRGEVLRIKKKILEEYYDLLPITTDCTHDSIHRGCVGIHRIVEGGVGIRAQNQLAQADASVRLRNLYDLVDLLGLHHLRGAVRREYDSLLRPDEPSCCTDGTGNDCAARKAERMDRKDMKNEKYTQHLLDVMGEVIGTPVELKTRKPDMFWARAIVAYHLYYAVGLTEEEVGRLLGRNHSTIHHSRDKMTVALTYPGYDDVRNMYRTFLKKLYENEKTD